MAPTGGPAIRVVVADDERHVLEYLELVLHDEGFVVVGTAADADGAVSAATQLQPDAVLLDLNMPGGGLVAAQLIGSMCPDTRVVIFSAEAPEPEILPLLRAGIDGYVLKGSSPEAIGAAVRAALAGEAYLAPAVGRVAVGALNERLHAEQRAVAERARERARIEDVVAKRRFDTVHQPVFELARRTPVGVEALTRFTAIPTRAPDVWFAEAERVQLRTSLELAAASQALDDLALLPAGMVMSLNVSPTTVVSGRLAEVLTGAPLERIVIELTEHAPVDDYRALTAALAPWRERGARLAVDDAGGGYASFAHILRLHPEYIKLDISLSHDINLDRPRQALARALVGYANEVGVGVIAEGIETEAELDTIIELGTPYGQGFHLGRPRPLHEQLDLLAPVVLELDPEVETQRDDVSRR